MDCFSPLAPPWSPPDISSQAVDRLIASQRILVADDEGCIVDLLSTLLDEEGFQVMKAYDGEEAWELARRNPPDLVISDVGMPRLDGLGLLRRLRRAPVLSQTPVILMSAVHRPIDVDRAAFVPKPFDIDRLLSVIETELAENESDQPRTPRPPDRPVTEALVWP